MRRPCGGCAESSESPTPFSGRRRFLNLERFAPAADWEELSAAVVDMTSRQEAAHDL